MCPKHEAGFGDPDADHDGGPAPPVGGDADEDVARHRSGADGVAARPHPIRFLILERLV